MATRASSSVFAPFAGTGSRATPPATARRFRWVADASVPLVLVLLASVAVLVPAGLSPDGRVALWAFAVAVILWSTTALNAAYVSLGAVMLLIVAGGRPQEALYGSLASDVVWLMIGAFVLGGAVQQTGLAGRLTDVVVRRARTVGGVFWLLSGALVVLSAVIPSTSGRAAVALPVFRSLSDVTGDRQVTRALALLVPSVILVATIGTLIGAGSHLIANDVLARIAGERISYAAWALYGVPFALVASAITTWVVLRLFLDRERRGRRLPAVPRTSERGPLSRAERTTLAVALAMLALWLTEAVHGLEIATVTVLGALALTLPGAGVLSWKRGLEAVSWNLVLFVGAALALGEALIETGAARWLIGRLFDALGVATADSPLVLLVLVTVIALTSHLYITSHAARAAALVPPLVYLARDTGLDPAAVMFIGTVGMNYCLTFPVSSKALLMFSALDLPTFESADLLRLGAVMLVVHLGLVVVFALTWWPLVGLAP